MSQSHWHSGLPVTEKWHVFPNYIMRQKWLMASNLIRGFGQACYSLTLSIMLRWNGYSVKHAHSFSILLHVLAGPGSIYWSIYKPAHATSLIKGDLMDETTYWLSNRIPAVDLRSLTVFISLLSSPSLCFSDAIQRCHSPSFPHWLASRLTAAVSVELEFNHCRFQQNMERCNVEASRSVATQCDSILSDCCSLYAVHLFLMTGVSSSTCYGFFFFPWLLLRKILYWVLFQYIITINPEWNKRNQEVPQW